jgi:hypothetical protein
VVTVVSPAATRAVSTARCCGKLRRWTPRRWRSHTEPHASWIAEAGTQRVEQRTVVIVRFGGDSSKKDHQQQVDGDHNPKRLLPCQRERARARA